MTTLAPSMGPLLVAMHATPDDQPVPLTPMRLLTAWTWDWWIILPALASVALYLYAVWLLRRRGIRWAPSRTWSFCLGGVGTGVVATMSALGTYDTVLISVHMVQHMVLAFLTPIFLALGAPVTLMLRVLPKRPKGWLSSALHSKLAKVLSFPVLTTGLFIINPYALYFSELYPLTLASPFWHNWLHVHFVLTGCMFFWPLIGIDPMPSRLTYPMRLLMLFVTIPFHAFLGVTIMGSPELLGEQWYLSFERTWGPSLLADQYLGGGIMWGASDGVLLIIMAVLFVQWFRASQREAKRVDRHLDRLEANQARRARAESGGASPPEPTRYDPVAQTAAPTTADEPSPAAADSQAREDRSVKE